MKALLTRLTLVLVVTVVAVLAVYLVLIALTLGRSRNNLQRVAEELEATRDHTRPLADDLPTINSAATGLRDMLRAVDGNLDRVLRAVRGGS